MPRYRAGEFKGEPAVIDGGGPLGPMIREVIATCGLSENAERIADALNRDEEEADAEPPRPQEARHSSGPPSFRGRVGFPSGSWV